MTAQPTVVAREWLSEEAGEAALTISDGTVSLVAFCHPCQVGVGDAPRLPLLAVDVKRVERVAPDAEPSLTRTSTVWGHMAVAKIVSRRERLVSVGSLAIELDQPLPGDLEDGETISFTCARLDMIGSAMP